MPTERSTDRGWGNEPWGGSPWGSPYAIIHVCGITNTLLVGVGSIEAHPLVEVMSISNNLVEDEVCSNSTVATTRSS